MVIFQKKGKMPKKAEVKSMAGKETQTVAEAANILKKEESGQNDTKVLVDAHFSIIGSDLLCKFLYKGKDKGYELLFAPDNVNNSNDCSLDQLVTDVTKYGGNDPTNDLKNWVGNGSLNDINFKLNMAFLYINQDEASQGGAPPQKQLEYAFQVEVTAGNVIPSEIQKFFNFTGIQLSVWNTNKPGVLEKMNLKTPDEALKDLETPPKKELNPPQN